jgi:NAD(P)-dependent dehydrogenase (short-subunit alcohol dehydrogenase family)
MIFRADALTDKNILITGASSGIGRETAIAMAACGARLALCGRNEEALVDTRAQLAGEGHSIFCADFAQFDEAHDIVVEAAKAAGLLHGVFHAAGVASLRIAKLYNSDHLDHVFGASVVGATAIAKACAKRKVLDDGGSLTLMSSVAGIRGRAGMGCYAASKAAIGGMTRALAAEFAPRRVRVNEIVSGAVVTAMHDDIVKNLDDAGQQAYANLHLLGFGQAEDVAAMAVFLASNAGRWVTGASIAVDGGYSAT